MEGDVAGIICQALSLGAISCTNCAAGTYQPSSGGKNSMECLACPQAGASLKKKNSTVVESPKPSRVYMSITQKLIHAPMSAG